MNEINDYKNRIYDNGVYNNEMGTFENDNYNNEVIASNEFISVLSVSNTNLNANSNTNSSTSSSNNSSNNSNANSNNTIITTEMSNIFCEFKQYIDEQVAPKTSNIIEYWKENNLWLKQSSEQMFSCAGHIIDNYYTSLDLDTVTALVY
ncbi:35478_t:CDS:2 [Gigaspora margarita]|uniref:35478_t:CDS:1 n=1 Tax=Gigaspora margarita TaxID=4874 RepID=A0ABN7UWZ0_GIGMA|nr:35478_t:CDS:2 [Gigaspora margarita]